MEDIMKILTTAILSLTLVMIGFVQVQSKSMDEKMDKADDMTTSQPMKHDDMKAKSDEMKMKHDDMKMKSDDMMKGTEGSRGADFQVESAPPPHFCGAG